MLESRAATPQRKIEQLEKARDRRIAKIQQEYAAKIETVQAEAESTGTHLTPEEHGQESSLLREYASAIVGFGENASPAELAPLLGVSTREAKKIPQQAKDDLAALGTVALPPTATPVPSPAADDDQPVTAAS